MRWETVAKMRKRNNINRSTKAIAFCSVLSALAVALMSIGIFLPTFDMVAAMFASYSVIITVCELGRGYATGVFLSAALLGILISPHNTSAWFFASFMGYYPLIKSIIEVRVKNRFTAIVYKFLFFNAAFAIIVFVSIKFLSFEEFIGWYAIALIALAELAFLLYDILLSKSIFAYYRMIRPRLKIGNFLRK